MTKDQLSWILLAFSIWGVILNNYKDKRCFIVWLFTNGFWALYFFSYGLYAPMTQQLIFFVLAIHGLWEWKKEAK